MGAIGSLVVGILKHSAEKGLCRLKERDEDRKKEVFEVFLFLVAEALKLDEADREVKLQELLDEADAGTIDLLLDGLRQMLDAVDPEARNYIAKLMADSLINNRVRDAFSRNLGRLISELGKGEATEYVELCRTISKALHQAKATDWANIDEVKIDWQKSSGTIIEVRPKDAMAPAVFREAANFSRALSGLQHYRLCGRTWSSIDSVGAYYKGTEIEILRQLTKVFL